MATTRQTATKTASSPARKATSTRQRGVPARASRKALGDKVTLRKPNGGTRAATAPRVAKSAPVRRAGRATPVGEAAAEVREGVARSLKGLMAVEAEIATLVRKTVANGLPDGAATSKELLALVREVVAGAIEGTEKAGTELVVSIKGIAKGVTMGVNDIRADLGKAAAETVRLAVKHAGRLRTDVAAVAERALEGIASAIDEVGGNAAALSKRVSRGAFAVSRKLGKLSTDTVTKILQRLTDDLEQISVPAPTAPRKRRAAAAPRTMART